jgi:VWFA-related protein
MSRHRVVALVLCALASAVGASAQKRQPPRFPIETSAVVLDVVVRDKHGQPVRDLTPDDFRVFEDGIEQTLDGFVVMDLGDEPASDTAERTAPASNEGAAATAAAATPSAERQEQVEAQPALIALVFDRLTPSGRDFARKAALTFVRDVRRPQDVVGVFIMDLALHAVGPFTAESQGIVASVERAAMMVRTGSPASEARAELREKQDTLARSAAMLQTVTAGRPTSGNDIGDIASGQTMEQMAVRRGQATEALERDQEGYACTRALQALIAGLARVRGRKTLLLFSEGLAVPAVAEKPFRRLIDSANKANVSIYAVDANGLRAESPIGEARLELEQIIAARERTFSGGDFDGSVTRRFERAEDRLRLSPGATLGPLASETGGLFVADSNDVGKRLHEMGEDMRFYYVLSYTARNQEHDGRFRKLAVKLRRKGLEVRTRHGYLAPRLDERGPSVSQR